MKSWAWKSQRMSIWASVRPRTSSCRYMSTLTQISHRSWHKRLFGAVRICNLIIGSCYRMRGMRVLTKLQLQQVTITGRMSKHRSITRSRGCAGSTNWLRSLWRKKSRVLASIRVQLEVPKWSGSWTLPCLTRRRSLSKIMAPTWKTSSTKRRNMAVICQPP